MDQYSRDLGEVINKPFVTKSMSWFTYITITAIIVIATIFTTSKLSKWCGPKSNHKNPNSTPESISNRILKVISRPVETDMFNIIVDYIKKLVTFQFSILHVRLVKLAIV